MPQMQNGVYANMPWVAPPEGAYPPQAYMGPFASNQERMISQALAVAGIPGAQLQEVVRPPLPQIQLFPPRFGYEEYELGVEDVIQVTSRTYERVDYSQAPTTQESSSRNTIGWGV